MDYLKYFKIALKNKAYRYKEWGNAVFCVTDLPSIDTYSETNRLHYPYRLYKSASNTYISVDENGTIFQIEINGAPAPIDDILVWYKEPVKVTPDEVVSCTEPTTLSAGNLFVNYYCLIHYVDGLFPLQTKKISAGTLEDLILTKIADDSIAENNPEKISVTKSDKMRTAICGLTGFVYVCVPSASYATILPSKEVLKRRQELYAKYEGQLDDPVTAAEIEQELDKLDAKEIEQDPVADGYYNGTGSAKKMKISRKAIHANIGLVSRLSDPNSREYIKQSLREGWKLKDLPILADGARLGSYSRGKLTALGGVEVKYIFRTFSTIAITMDDCGTTMGIERKVKKENIADYYDTYVKFKGAEFELLTPETASKYADKLAIYRSPGYCKADPRGKNKCACCMGSKFKNTKTALAVLASEVGSRMNTIFMKAMHGSSAKTIKFDYKSEIF